MNHLLAYEEETSFQGRDPNSDWEELVSIGKGWVYGLEAQVEKQEGELKARLGYTLSWSFRQFDDINEGKPFPFRYDRRHDLSLDLIWQPKSSRQFGLIWIYGSGQAVTSGAITLSFGVRSDTYIHPGPSKWLPGSGLSSSGPFGKLPQGKKARCPDLDFWFV